LALSGTDPNLTLLIETLFIKHHIKTSKNTNGGNKKPSLPHLLKDVSEKSTEIIAPDSISLSKKYLYLRWGRLRIKK